MSSIKDGNLLVTLQDGMPCYYYPMDDYTRAKPYFLGSLGVSWNNRRASLGPLGMWQMQNGPEVRTTYSPSSADTCLRYGDLPQGTRQKGLAEPHHYGMPYSAHLTVFPEAGWERKYLVTYCLVRDSAGNPRLQATEYSIDTDRYECRESKKD